MSKWDKSQRVLLEMFVHIGMQKERRPVHKVGKIPLPRLGMKHFGSESPPTE